MKKDSIQTRKRKPKGQGKTKGQKRATKDSEAEKTAQNKRSTSSPIMYNSYVTPMNSIVHQPGHADVSAADSAMSSSMLSASMLDSSHLIGANMSSAMDRNSVSPVLSIENGTNHPGYIDGSSPDSGIGNARINTTTDSSVERRIREIRSSPESEGYSPMPRYIVESDLDGFDKKPSSAGDVTSHPALAALYFNGESGSDPNLLHDSSQVNSNQYLDGQPPTSPHLSAESASQSSLSYNGLTALYATGSNSSSSLKSVNRHFHHQYHPYARYTGHRPSYIKAEPTVM